MNAEADAAAKRSLNAEAECWSFETLLLLQMCTQRSRWRWSFEKLLLLEMSMQRNRWRWSFETLLLLQMCTQRGRWRWSCVP